MLKGIAASEGIGIGRAVIIAPQEITYQTGPVADIEQEKARLHRAIDDFISYTEELAGKLEETLDAENADIIRGHVTMLSDPFMIEEMEELIAGGQSAEAAAESVLDMFQGLFQSAEDELTRQRATDVEDIKRKLLEILLGMEQLDLKHLPDHTVLVVSDLAPSVTAEMDHDSVIGVVTENGGMTSHSAILSRALEIPAVLSVPDALSKIKDGQKLIVDGTNGTVIVDPSAETTVKYQTCRDDYIREKELLKAFQGKATVTRDGDPRQVFCNIGNPKDAESAAEHDGEGIGLFRTEFLFMDRDARPDEETQYAAYRQVCETLKGKTVIIRTLDVGGDKDIPYIHMEKEENPFLGYRAVRYCLSNQEAYKIQLRALIRAGADTGGNLRIMIPMVTTATEIQTVRRLAEEICRETRLPMPEIGTMIETPAAAVMSDVLAKEVDFFIIGTNDLLQYTLAVDRQNERLEPFYDPRHPAVLRLIEMTVRNAHAAGCTVGICGEMGADPQLTETFLKMGVDELSVSPSSLLKIRKKIRETDLSGKE